MLTLGKAEVSGVEHLPPQLRAGGEQAGADDQTVRYQRRQFVRELEEAT